MVVFLVRLSKQYAREDRALEHEVPQAVAAPIRRRLVVMVFVDRLDLAVARAMQLGRSLRPDELRAVHFVIDQQQADHLAENWREHGLANMSLELVDCPDRRLTRAAVVAVAHELSAGDAEVCVLLPERMFEGGLHRILHDSTAAAMAREIAKLPHANVTTVPFHFDEAASAESGTNGHAPAVTHGDGKAHRSTFVTSEAVTVAERNGAGTTPIGDVRWRQQVCVEGRVQAIRVEPLAGSPSMECTLVDETGGVSLVFFGRRHIDGVVIGTTMRATGMAIEHRNRLAIVNPVYELK
jgi:hypothetical protein